ncbi:S-adenosyl-L-methionine-dependent methyltransferase [Eremomyces bilateralis CBS 781.70]|uniref:S-adenosyl-L-methionine-dependent methyltransferase n=1 Tax=Eremomyces bilateralis CBS 781.70 TaxID=1392243 RepID=A0A6G1FR58_9PEZI|nr:S-adenosyl-L-methionine-dependent methyltransferase [Eremomyces bilateralis CBS 781.70]KAF1808226.1 S-adenosyl-L-methionine-dependent methyltransferase [Eremomyces bilateralis CBS 781.70]
MAPPPPPLGQRLLGHLRPMILILLMAQAWSVTILTLLLKLDLRTLFTYDTLRHKAFGRMWAKYGDLMSREMPLNTAALLATVRGTVLDLGPGSGSQLYQFTPGQIDVAYGVEPAVDLHVLLRAAAEKRGFEGRYKVVTAGAEPESLVPALAREGVIGEGGAEVFDEIVCVRVLCGVPRQEEVVKGLYRLLKPGGRLVVSEHVVNPWRLKEGSIVARGLQIGYHLLGWKFWAGGCCMDRDTEKSLKEAGSWSKIALERSQSWAVIPHIVGYLVKA